MCREGMDRSGWKKAVDGLTGLADPGTREERPGWDPPRGEADSVSQQDDRGPRGPGSRGAGSGVETQPRGQGRDPSRLSHTHVTVRFGPED